MIPLSETVCDSASSETVLVLIAVIVGSSLTGLTVTEKMRLRKALSLLVERLPSSPPSSTLTRMSADPEAFETGV